MFNLPEVSIHRLSLSITLDMRYPRVGRYQLNENSTLHFGTTSSKLKFRSQKCLRTNETNDIIQHNLCLSGSVHDFHMSPQDDEKSGHTKIPRSFDLDHMFAEVISSGNRVDCSHAIDDLRHESLPTILDGHPQNCHDFIRKLAHQLFEIYSGRHEKYISDVLVPDRREDLVHTAHELY